MEPEVVLVDGVADGEWARARRVAEELLFVEKRCVTSRLVADYANVPVKTAGKVLRRLAKRYGLVKRGDVYCPPGGGGDEADSH